MGFFLRSVHGLAHRVQRLPTATRASHTSSTIKAALTPMLPQTYTP